MNDLIPIHALMPMLPEIVLAVGAMALLMIGVIGKGKGAGVNALSTVLLIGVAVLVYMAPPERVVMFGGSFVVDGFARFLKILAVLGAAGAMMLSLDYLEQEKQQKFEYGPLVVLSTLGMCVLISANDLIALYLGLELMSLALYVIAASEDRKSVV